jgi:hypothetical protein
MHRWVGIARDGKRFTGEARSALDARDAALRASDGGEVYVYDERGRLLPWCSVDAYAGEGPQG